MRTYCGRRSVTTRITPKCGTERARNPVPSRSLFPRFSSEESRSPSLLPSRDAVNTIAAQTNRIPRVVPTVRVALVAASAPDGRPLGVVGGPDSDERRHEAAAGDVCSSCAATPAGVTTPAVPARARSSSSPVSHRAWRTRFVTEGDRRRGLRRSGCRRPRVRRGGPQGRPRSRRRLRRDQRRQRQAGATVAKFAGEVSSPSTLIVRRPGRIVMQFSGPVESAIVRQAAHNAGARR